MLNNLKFKNENTIIINVFYIIFNNRQIKLHNFFLLKLSVKYLILESEVFDTICRKKNISTLCLIFIMFICKYCEEYASRFSQNSKILICDNHVISFIKEDRTDHLLSFEAPLTEEYKMRISEEFNSRINKIKAYTMQLLDSLLKLNLKISNYGSEILKNLNFKKLELIKVIKKIEESTLTMNDARNIYLTDLDIESSDFIERIQIINEQLSEIFFIQIKKSKGIIFKGKNVLNKVKEKVETKTTKLKEEEKKYKNERKKSEIKLQKKAEIKIDKEQNKRDKSEIKIEKIERELTNNTEKERNKPEIKIEIIKRELKDNIEKERKILVQKKRDHFEIKIDNTEKERNKTEIKTERELEDNTEMDRKKKEREQNNIENAEKTEKNQKQSKKIRLKEES